ncbi:hypothetical protein AAMO2058_001709600 [Amorphochlora amoebiformis]
MLVRLVVGLGVLLWVVILTSRIKRNKYCHIGYTRLSNLKIRRVRGGSGGSLDDDNEPYAKIPIAKDTVDVEGFGKIPLKLPGVKHEKENMTKLTETLHNRTVKALSSLDNITPLTPSHNVTSRGVTRPSRSVTTLWSSSRSRDLSESEELMSPMQAILGPGRTNVTVKRLQGVPMDPGRKPKNQYDFPIWEYQEYDKSRRVEYEDQSKSAYQEMMGQFDSLGIGGDSDALALREANDNYSPYVIDDTDIEQEEDQEEYENRVLMQDGFTRYQSNETDR